jgi:hypothetical protein
MKVTGRVYPTRPPDGLLPATKGAATSLDTGKASAVAWSTTITGIATATVGIMTVGTTIAGTTIDTSYFPRLEQRLVPADGDLTQSLARVHPEPWRRWGFETRRPLLTSLIRRDALDAIILAGTDLALISHESNISFAHVDCARVHLNEIQRAMLD